MTPVSQTHLDELLKAHGNSPGIVEALRAVELGQYIPLENLLDSVRSLSTDISKHQPNAYIFASGPINTSFQKYPGTPPAVVDYRDYTTMLVERGDRFTTIGGTQAARFLEDYDNLFREALENTIKGSGLTKDSGAVLGADDLLHGYAGADGKRVPGLWDDLSRGYAENAQGHIITVTPNADAERVFVQTELPALLENPKVETINALPRQAFVDEFERLKSAGASADQAYQQLSDTLVKSSSISFMKQFAASRFTSDLGVNMRNDFTGVSREDILKLTENVDPQIVGLESLSASVPEAEKSLLRSAFDMAAPGVKKLGMVTLGALPVVGLLADTAEAQELDGKVQAAITRSEISEGALLEYHTILAGKIAAGFDPSVLGGDIGVQAAFNDWAERNHVQGELREALQPSSLALMMRDGAGYIVENADRIPESIADVSVFTAQQGLNGVEYAAGAVWGAADGAYDSFSGNTAEMQAIYDSLPVLSYNTQGGLENGAGPIRDYPSAHALAEIKTSLVRTQQMIDGINEGTRPPVSGMNAEESTAFLSERMARLHQSFEDHFAQAQADGTLSEVSDYLSGHGGTAQADAPPDTMDTPVRSFALAGGTAMRM